jgi:hypothetical protein
MKCFSVVAALMLLLLATAGPCAAGGRLKDYIVNPASYLNVVTRPSVTSTMKDYMSDPAAGHCINSSSSTDVPAADAVPPCSALQNPDSSSQGSSSIEDVTSAAAASGRMLLQGPANPARLQKPYLVCLSPWIPMVHCDTDTDPADWKGESMSSTKHIGMIS